MSLCGLIGMSASSYNGINDQALNMYVIMWTRWHVGVTADIIASWALAHQCIDAPTCRQAIRPSNVLIFTHCKKLSIII